MSNGVLPGVFFSFPQLSNLSVHRAQNKNKTSLNCFFFFCIYFICQILYFAPYNRLPATTTKKKKLVTYKCFIKTIAKYFDLIAPSAHRKELKKKKWQDSPEIKTSRLCNVFANIRTIFRGMDTRETERRSYFRRFVYLSNISKMSKSNGLPILLGNELDSIKMNGKRSLKWD